MRILCRAVIFAQALFAAIFSLLIMSACLGAGYDNEGFPAREPQAAQEPEEGRTEDEAEEEEELIFLPDRPVTLGLGLEKGKTYNYETYNIINMSFLSATPEMPLPEDLTVAVTTSKYSLIVDDDKSEDFTVTQVINDIETESDLGLIETSTAIKQAIAGSRITFVISPDGAVKSIQGIDELWSRIAEGSCDSGNEEIIINTFKQMLNDKSLKQQMKSLFGARPYGTIAPGHTWSDEFPIGIMSGADTPPLTVNGTFDGLVNDDGREAVLLTSFAEQEYPEGLPLLSGMFEKMAPGMGLTAEIEYIGMETFALLHPESSELMYQSSDIYMEMRLEMIEPESGMNIEIVQEINVYTEVSLLD